jgi:hypothetical protein
VPHRVWFPLTPKLHDHASKGLEFDAPRGRLVGPVHVRLLVRQERCHRGNRDGSRRRTERFLDVGAVGVHKDRRWLWLQHKAAVPIRKPRHDLCDLGRVYYDDRQGRTLLVRQQLDRGSHEVGAEVLREGRAAESR